MGQSEYVKMLVLKVELLEEAVEDGVEEVVLEENVLVVEEVIVEVLEKFFEAVVTMMILDEKV